MRAPAFDRSTLSRALYSSDASLYRVVPEAVYVPSDSLELSAAVDQALAERLPITMRGSGTSCAGNAIGPGLVIDTRRLDAITSLDPGAALAVVQPGVVQSVLSAAAAAHALRFGPDPSSSSRCTVGGMIGNNACGPRALGYGKTSDVVEGLELINGAGERLSLRRSTDLREHPSPTLHRLHRLVQANLGVIRTEFGRFGRQVSGYSLEHLLPERGFDVTRFLVGSEGTLGVVTEATVRLSRDPVQRCLVVLGYPSLAAAADAVPAVLAFEPTACEGLDARIVDTVRARHGAAAVPALPPGAGWLFVELAGDDPDEVAQRAFTLAAGHQASRVIAAAAEQATLWRLRSDGAGYAGIALTEPAHPGWEDAAVPPERLGDYLRDFEALLVRHGLHGLPYGHFGEGCVHCRIDFPLGRSSGSATYRRFVEESADLVAGYGGSLSGEHGDGRARSDLLGRMYSPAALRLFAQVKALFDPNELLNPGVLVRPAAVDADVRLAQAPHPLDALAADVHRCSGVGRCVAAGAVDAMCPSYQVTRRERDSTRGRARVLQELAIGGLVSSPRSRAVTEALELCLACKACATDCPTGVDLARDKSVVLERAHAGRLRPLTHYTLGWLPRWTRLVTAVPGLAALANALTHTPVLRTALLRLAGVDARRTLPQFRTGRLAEIVDRTASELDTFDSRPPLVEPVDRTASELDTFDSRPPLVEPVDRTASELDTFDSRPPLVEPVDRTASELDTFDSRSPLVEPVETPRLGRVAVWADSFSLGFAGGHVKAMIQVLARAGYQPELIGEHACCGLTWITTGQRAAAAARLRRSLDVLTPLVQAGVPIVGVEPSCLAVWRDEASELVDDPRLAVVQHGLHTLAELLGGTTGWQPPDLAGRTVVVQPHCHHRAVLGWASDATLLRRTGARVVTVTGCCGLAGNFGVERGHYDVSVAVAGLHLLPALAAAPPDALVLADGFSCRTQIADLAGRPSMSLAELLANSH
ncbi:FAD-binding and (Fe-S)-binding domain-containing protein [Micropruina sp.]|uniref:FAD-binding and (Fe-S)-binding domain-containing protein n=1 Tax=Micropruina sp. TaxID=2737536 RepID=UPI0039E308AA